MVGEGRPTLREHYVLEGADGFFVNLDCIMEDGRCFFNQFLLDFPGSLHIVGT